MQKRFLVLLGGGLLLTVLAGCGDSSGGSSSVDSGSVFGPTSTASQTRSLTIHEPEADQLARDGDFPDTLEIEAIDASGNIVFGPVDLPFTTHTRVDGIPVSATELQIDYLRNGGYMLFRAHVPITGDALTVTPDEVEHPYQNTRVSVTQKPDGFHFSQEFTGVGVSFHGSHQHPTLDKTGVAAKDAHLFEFKIKGICYSPAPINFSNKEAPAVGDLFWDSFKAGPDDIFNWAALWDTFYDENIGNSRADLDTIRSLGANTIRLYSAISYQLGTDGSFGPQSKDTLRTHKAFLDACYANNKAGKTLRVIVDVPMPAVCFEKFLKDGLDKPEGRERTAAIEQRAKEIEWWDVTFKKTVEDLSKHPAVIAINIMNEQDSARAAHPNAGQGPADANTDYFYSQAKKYSDMVKEAGRQEGAEVKACGWGFHDSPDLVVFGQAFPTTGPKYLEQLTSFDYWGINTYQTINLDSITGKGFRGSYADLPASMKKPILLTELGWPCTGHDTNGKLVVTEETITNTSKAITRMYDLVYNNPLYLGACYFEFSDEWWKQAGGASHTWDPTTAGPTGFPNSYWDEEGFGLYGVQRQGNRPDNDLVYITFGDNPTAQFGPKGPKMPYDKLVPRTTAINALKEIFKKY